MARNSSILLSTILSFLFACQTYNPEDASESSMTHTFICQESTMATQDSLFSLFALIGENQTKVADVKKCNIQNPNIFSDSSYEIVAAAKVDSIEAYFFMSKRGEEYWIEKKVLDEKNLVAKFKKGKFYFE